MKKIIVALLMLVAGTFFGFAQFEEKLNPVDVRVGTYKSYKTQETLFFTTFTGEEKAKTQVLVSIAGPKGWNDNKPYEKALEEVELSDDWYRIYVDAKPVVGKYNITITLPGEKNLKFERTLSEVKYFAEPKVSIVRQTTQSVRATWTAVPGAQFYIVQIENEEDSLKVVVTTATSVTMSGLELESGADYYVSVEAVNYPRVGEAIYLDLPKMVMSSYGYLDFSPE